MNKKFSFWAFIFSFILAAAFVMNRMIDYPAATPEYLTINFYLVVISLGFALMFGIIFVSWDYLSSKKKFIRAIDESIFYILLVLGSGLAWSLRGVWGHQTGTAVFGSIVSLIIAVKLPKIDMVYFLFLQVFAFSIGAMIPFATYPVIPRVVAFGIWGGLGGLFAGITLIFDSEGKKISFTPGQKQFYFKSIITLSFTGFIALSLGVVLWQGLTANSGWFDPALGGFFSGGVFGVIYYQGIKRCHVRLINAIGENTRENSMHDAHSKDMPARDRHVKTDNTQVDNAGKNYPAGKDENKARFGSYIRHIIWLVIYMVIPVVTIINTLDYLNLERSRDVPLMPFIIGIVAWECLLLLLAAFKKLSPRVHVKAQLIILFLLITWTSSLSAILRNDVVFDEIPILWKLISNSMFERLVFFFAIMVSILFPIVAIKIPENEDQPPSTVKTKETSIF
ncbi:MAG: hypothetical protein ACTSVI_16380 [Promethearchaeota archaeon]